MFNTFVTEMSAESVVNQRAWSVTIRGNHPFTRNPITVPLVELSLMQLLDYQDTCELITGEKLFKYHICAVEIRTCEHTPMKIPSNVTFVIYSSPKIGI